MADEDQGSHYDDPEEQEPIKVSVTFKPQEQETDENHNTDPDQSYAVVKPSSGDPQKDDDTCNDSEAEEPSLPVNPPVTPIPLYLDADKADSEGHEIEQQEVLEGWKGYSNNIYIQPIIVNHASCEECHCPTNNKTQRRLTSEDLRKQMRLREANNWITKHNERIQSTGTLRTKTQFQEKQSQQPVKEIPKQTKLDKDTAKPKQRRTKNNIHKGFVCRTWATNFLPKDAQKNEDDEFIPFFVRKYVDKSNSNLPDTEKESAPLAEENRKTSELTSTQTESEDALSQKAEELIEVQLKEKPYFHELNNRRKGRRTKSSTDNDKNLTSVPHAFICSCGQTITHDKEVRNSRTSHLRHERSRNSNVRFSVALPIKQFPPINPLEEMKKPDFPVRKKRGVLPTRRPHTVDTALLSKGAILVNGHHNLPNFTNAREPFNRLCSGQRVTTSSLENLSKERKIFSRAKSSEQDCDAGGKSFDEVIELLSWGAGSTLERNATPPSVLHEEQNRRRRCGRYRSLSDPRGTAHAAKPSQNSLDENQNNLYRGSVECFTGNRRRIRTPLHSLNSEDGDSNTDSNDTGLGSEIEYSFDGLAKLDVYLQPRSTSFS